MSGAAGYMDDIIDDLDMGQTKVFSEDDSGDTILSRELGLIGKLNKWSLSI